MNELREEGITKDSERGVRERSTVLKEIDHRDDGGRDVRVGEEEVQGMGGAGQAMAAGQPLDRRFSMKKVEVREWHSGGESCSG